MTRIAIIGAGITGLACAKTLSDAGFQPVLFDKGVELVDVLPLVVLIIIDLIMVRHTLIQIMITFPMYYVD